MIQLEKFCKCYGTEKAVDNLSFEVLPGQVLGLIGRNGAGKTSTLRALTGIIPPTSGKLSVAGFDLVEAPIQAKQHAAYVPDDPQLFNDLSVEQHLRFTASVYGVSSPANKISDLLQRFELTEKRHSPASGLSRGMRQKLAICCAYLHEPSALLLDEPMTGLDPPGIRNLKQSIQEHAARGAAVIISSHLLAMVEDICSHVLIIERGQMKFHGSLDQIRAQVRDNDSSSSETSLEEVFFAALDDCQSEVRQVVTGSSTGTPTQAPASL